MNDSNHAWVAGLFLAAVGMLATASGDVPPEVIHHTVIATPTAGPTVTPTRLPTYTPTATTVPTSSVNPDWRVDVPWTINCDDDNPYNGYMNQGYCVPGWVDWESSHFANPKAFAGAMSSYAQGVMEIVCEKKGNACSGYRGVAAVMGCGNINQTAYLRRPGGEWYGPLLIIDCTGQKDAFVNILVKEIAIEVDYETARELGALTIGWVEVRINSSAGPAGGFDLPLSQWWRKNRLAFVWPGVIPTATPVP